MRNCLSQRFSRLVRKSGESAGREPPVGLDPVAIAERLANSRGGGEALSVISFQLQVKNEEKRRGVGG